MKIKDVKPGMRSITLIGKVIEKGKPSEVFTKFGPAIHTTAILQDDTGKILLNLWRNQVSAVQVGDTVKIEGAFSKIYRGILEINIGRTGSIKVLRRGHVEKTT